MKTTTYQDRVKAHDILALPAVDYLFSLMGYSHFELGIEREKKKFRDALKNRNDPQALKIRFSPDRLYSKNDQNIVICEVKSEYSQWSNFSIEFDSYLQAVKYSEDGYLYAFVDISKWDDYFSCQVFFSRIEDIPIIQEFIVPKHHPLWELFVARIKKDFPATNISFRDNSKGSGTPYFLLPKRSDFMIKPSVFFDSIKNEFLKPILFNREYTRIDIPTSQTITLPILAALDYLYERGLTIDRLWTEQPDNGPPQTHITTKPAQDDRK
jgi:hypothetical protein